MCLIFINSSWRMSLNGNHIPFYLQWLSISVCSYLSSIKKIKMMQHLLFCCFFLLYYIFFLFFHFLSYSLYIFVVSFFVFFCYQHLSLFLLHTQPFGKVWWWPIFGVFSCIAILPTKLPAKNMQWRNIGEGERERDRERGGGGATILY